MLKDDIFFAKIKTASGTRVKICNTATEKDFKPTPDTVALLDLCTGTNRVNEIIAILSEQSGESTEEVAEGVHIILRILQEKGIITVNPSPLKRSIPGAKKVKVNYPIESGQIEITNRCNLSCVHCVNQSGDPCSNELATEEICSAIDRMSSLGAHQITLTGGEPLMHPDLFKIIEHARKAPMAVIILTNGTLITEEHVKKFKELGVNRFAVSIDSMDEDIHDTFRGQKGALKKALNSVNLLKDAGFSVRIAVSLNQYNKNDIVDTLKKLKEHDLTDYQFAEVNFSGRGIEGVSISPEEYYRILVEQLTYFKEENPEKIFEFPFKSGEGCGIARHKMCIKADGTIIPCQVFSEEMGVGNIRDVDLAVFWDTNETLEKLRKMRTENDETCKECMYLRLCDGCIANAFNLEGELRCYDPHTCARTRAYGTVFGIKG